MTDAPMPIRATSYGGGEQSTALLVLAAERRIDFPLFLFANVGDDSEGKGTLSYVREVAMPYAEAHGIELVELCRIPVKGVSAGKQETLYGSLTRPGSRSLPIPVRMRNGAPGTRSCTADFKIRVIERELRRRGATKDDPALVAIGISVDEFQRAAPGLDPKSPLQVRTYPMLYRSVLDPYSDDLGLRREDCPDIIRGAGLPVPPKSACWFCPFHTLGQWRRMKSEEPETYAKSVELEAMLNRRRDSLGKDHVYLTRFGKPLDEVCVGTQDSMLDEDEGCESGWCMT
jgi:hypothetical protein